jgi:hypothetical protein
MGSPPLVSFHAFCIFCSAIVKDVDLDVGCAGTHGGGDANASLRQVVQGEPSAGVMDGDDEQIIQCLEHVRPCDLSFAFFFVWHHDVTVSGCVGSLFDESPCE